MEQLPQIPIFQGVNSAELDKLAALADKHTFQSDTIVFFEGDQADSLYVIVSGSVKVYQTAQDGQVKILATVAAGETLGELTLLDGQARSATVETLEPTEMLMISHRMFREFVDRHPEVLWKVVQSLCDRIRGLNRENVELAFEELPYRVVSTLTTMAAERGQKAKDNKITLHVDIGELGQRVGVDRRELGRILEALAKRDLVDLRFDEVVVSDSSVLERALAYAREW